MRKKDGQTEGFHSKSGLCLHMTLQQQLPSPPPCRWHDVGSGNPSSACTTPQPPVGGAAVDESLGWRLFIALYLPVCSRDLADLSCDPSVCVCLQRGQPSGRCPNPPSDHFCNLWQCRGHIVSRGPQLAAGRGQHPLRTLHELHGRSDAPGRAACTPLIVHCY